MSVPLCYYGSPDPLPPRRVLRAGPLTAVYETGDLRYVKVGGLEVCRRWYAAVRDRNWGTVPGVISDEVIEETEDGFRVSYTSTHRQGDVHFVWRAEIVGEKQEAASTYGVTPAAHIVFKFDGEARTTFLRNRIGFCVLHPPRCAGLPVQIHHPDGTITMGLQFPELIAPVNPFRIISTIQPCSSHQAWWTFEGDVFETEDQRNWIDASFKTFCTPLSRPFPVEVKTGERVTQTVSMTMIGGWGESESSLALTIADRAATLPDVGLALGEQNADSALLRLLLPAHLRVELDLTRPGFADRLRHATAEASAIGSKLELAVTVSNDAWEETKPLIDALHAIDPPLARVLAFHAAEWCTPERIVTPVVEALARFDITVPIFVGTAANFTELNRGRPDPTHADGVCYSIQPQEHALDNASLVECCAAIADTVRTARSFCGDKPLSVGPITLRKRVNPYATGPWEQPPPDPRQPTLFGAAWTLGALKYLAESGVASATFYETTGPRGVMDGVRVFPLFHVLADATELAGADVLKCESSDPLRFDALVLRSGDRLRVMLVNMTAEPQTVTLDGLPAEVQIRTLDETTFESASTDPVAFRRQIGDTLPTADGRLTLSLRPYGYVRIDG